MTPSHTKFYRDKANGKLAGVCAGIADYTGIDATLVRIGFMALVFMSGGTFVPLYFVAAVVAPAKPSELTSEPPEKAKFWQGVRASPRRTIRDVRSRFREIDRRMVDVETYITSSNSRLAREIDQLR